MSIHTRSQKLAQAAYARIAQYGKLNQEYTSFAKKFPALIHTCGLAQAVAFAEAKKEHNYLTDLAEVLQAAGHTEIANQEALGSQSRTQSLSGYLRLSHNALLAAGWLKRYVEALAEK